MNSGGRLGDVMHLPSRRAFLLATAISVWALVMRAGAAPTDRVMRVGVVANLAPGEAADASAMLTGFDRELRDRGWIEDENIRYEHRYTRGDPSLLPEIMAELVALDVDVIFTRNGTAAVAAKKATDRIPIVFVAGDPVGRGLVASLSRPGGNATGTSEQFVELQAKKLELLKQIAPRISKVAALMNPVLGLPPRLFSQSPVAEVQIVALRGAQDLDVASAAIVSMRADAVLVAQTWVSPQVRAAIVETIAKLGLPAVFPVREYVQFGGLLSYGVESAVLLRQAAIYVDKILRGAKPADLPVEQPMAFDLAVNLKTAKRLGIAIPRDLLARADLAIE